MKQLMTPLLIVLMCTGQLIAQEETKRNALTFDIAGIAERAFSDNQRAIPFQVMYRHFGQSGNALRVGFATQNQKDENQEGDDLETHSAGMTTARLGYEKRTTLDERWTLAAGVDGILELGQSKFIQQSGEFKFEEDTKSTGTGLALIAGVHYSLGRRVSLGTECHLEWVRTDTQMNTRSSFPDTAESSSQDIGTRTRVVLPAMLLLSVTF